MASRDTSPTGRVQKGVAAGLFKECSKAEEAIADLKYRGFADSQIGVAHSAGASTDKPERSFWDRIRGKNEPEEEVHYTEPTQFEDSLETGGLPTDQAHYFAARLEPGGCLVSVNAISGRAAEAIAILEKYGADIGSRAAEYRDTTPRAVAGGERRIQLLGEMLRVHKERVNRGEVRVHKQTVTETKNIEVPVSREEVVIERVPASGEPARGEIGASGQDKEIRIPLTEEQVRVEKETGVTGEVRVAKRQVQETRNVSDQVRHEEVKVDKEGDVDLDETQIRDKRDKAA